MADVRPFYVAVPGGQLRVWRVGEGPPCVVLPGLINGAKVVAGRLATANPPMDAVVIELPGLGGSAGIWPADLDTVAGAIAASVRALGLGRTPVLALDLCAPLAAALAHDGHPVLLQSAAGRDWAKHGVFPPPSKPLADGTHLTALFAFLRDRHVLDPAEPWRARANGEALPNAAALNDTLVAAALRPGAFAMLWQTCIGAMTDGSDVETWDDASRQIRAAAPAVQPAPAAAMIKGWRQDYATTPGGRMHLRRAGPVGQRPVIALHSAPGSSAPLAGLMEALATDRDVIAPDYLGNGESDKPPGRVNIAELAQNIVALADSLGLRRFDLWGTHTGALVALEAGLAAPGRVGRVILEGPVLLPPSLNSDILANYFPPLEPHPWGLHLQQAWNMRRDMFLFWPWYRAELAAARPMGAPNPEFLHDWTIGLLQSGASYHRSYRAAFEYDTAARLPLLGCPSLVCAGQADMLVGSLATARAMKLPRVTVQQTPAQFGIRGNRPKPSKRRSRYIAISWMQRRQLYDRQPARHPRAQQVQARHLLLQCRRRRRAHHRAGALESTLGGHGQCGADRREIRLGVRASGGPLARLRRGQPARPVLRDDDAGRGTRRDDQPHQPVRHRSCAARASAARGQVHDDGGPCQRRSGGAEHRRRLEPGGVRHVWLRPSRTRGQICPGTRMEPVVRPADRRGGVPFDHDGRFYQGRGMVCAPGARQKRLPTLNAAFSPAGRDFAAEVSDVLFTLVTSPEQVERDVAAVAAKSEAAGRSIGIMTTCYVVCRPTRQEAENYHQYYACTMADRVLLDRTLASKGAQNRHHFTDGRQISADEQLRLDTVRLHYAGGNGSHPVIGSPDDVAEQLIGLSRMGLAGTTLSFVDFSAELPFFCETVLPLLQRARLRV